MATRIICGDCGGTIATIKTRGILRREDRERISLCAACRFLCSIEATEEPKRLLAAGPPARERKLA